MVESQPPLEQGGRTNSVAVNPLNRNLMLAASDSGGLFRSMDGGATWRHLGGLPVVYTQSAVYLPADPTIVLVSAKADFKTTNGGGVWRSTDGGTTWAPANLPLPNANRISAYGISAVGDDVVVGTTEGIFVSANGGVSWEYSDPFGFSDKRVFAVLLTPGNPSRIYAAGPAGVRLNTLPLAQWDSPVTNLGGAFRSVNALARSPLSASHAFITNGDEVWRTENRGVNWTRISSAPKPSVRCAGAPFVKAAVRSKGSIPQFLDLYFGNTCDLHRLYVRLFPGPDYSGTWQQLAVEHDPRDLALFGTEPVLVASNGGLHKTADAGLNWTYTGGGTGGYNALQVTEVKGQLIRNLANRTVSQLDLYFGTQDNNVWAMRFPGIVQRFQEREGFYLDMKPAVQFEAESRITYAACGPCQPYRADRHLANPVEVHHSAAAPIPNAAPVFVRQGQHLLNVPHGLDITLDPDMAVWQPFAVFLEPPVGRARIAFAAAGDSTYAWQPYRDGAATKLMKIHHIDGVGHITRPAMQNFGSLAVNRVMGDVAYPVYSDNSRVLDVIAADIGNKRMMQTWSGGETWTEIPGLTGLVRKGNTLLFAAQLPDRFETMPLVTSISFHPELPSHILIGTSEGGIYYSSDRGQHWGPIGGSERVPNVTSFFWENLNSVLVSSFGRGLWRLRNRPIALPEAFDDLCGTCQVLSDDGAPAPFDASVLVYDGRILGVRREGGQLREVFVTTGSSFVFTGDPKDLQEDILITESDGKQTFDPLPKPPQDGWIVTGIVFTSDDTITGTVFSESEMSLPGK